MNVQGTTVANAKKLLDYSDIGIGKIDGDHPSALVHTNIVIQLNPQGLTPKQTRTFLRKVRSALRSFKDTDVIGFSLQIGQVDDFALTLQDEIVGQRAADESRGTPDDKKEVTKTPRKAAKKAKRKKT